MILASQVINGMLLPFVLLFMILIVNKKRVMKEWVNPGWYNTVAWTAVVLCIALTLVLVALSLQDLRS
jgi:Mn2+/Fe2+ NRAMP family transporter